MESSSTPCERSPYRTIPVVSTTSREPVTACEGEPLLPVGPSAADGAALEDELGAEALRLAASAGRDSAPRSTNPKKFSVRTVLRSLSAGTCASEELPTRCARPDELAQALVLLVTGWTSVEMRAQAWDPLVRGFALEFELDVLVDLLEALVAEHLGL